MKMDDKRSPYKKRCKQGQLSFYSFQICKVWKGVTNIPHKFICLYISHQRDIQSWRYIYYCKPVTWIRIILEIATFFTYLPAKLISETSLFGFKDLSFQLVKSSNSKPWKHLFVWQKTCFLDKNSLFLSQIKSMLSHILLLSSSFLVFEIIHFIFYAVPIICMMQYPILSGSL